MNFAWLTTWWNLIFVAPFALALLYLGLYTATGITFGDVDADSDLDADHDLGIDHDISADIDADADHDLGADHDADTDHESSVDQPHPGASGGWGGPLQWLGVGRVPVSIIGMVFLFAWGILGVAANRFASGMQLPAGPATLSIPVALVGAMCFTSLITAAMRRWIPLDESYPQRRSDMLGLVGQAIFPIDDKFGQVSVHAPRGDLLHLPCRVFDGASPLPKDSLVKLVGYNKRQNLFYVTQATSATGAAANKAT